jgi:hypothetical protein
MLDPTNVPAIAPDELIARYIVASKHLRNSDQTVKPDAFLPAPGPSLELSVNRHRSATEQELWDTGCLIASASQRTLYGRADLEVRAATALNLDVRADPVEAEPARGLPANPNHAVICGWPMDDLARRRLLAAELAAAATYLAAP